MKKILCTIGVLGIISSASPIYGQTTEIYDEKLSSLKEKLKTNPYDAFVYYNIGKHYSLKDKHLLAISYYEKALEISEDNVKAKYALAKEYEKIKKYDKALNLFVKLLKQDENNTNFLYLKAGKACFNCGDIDQAIEYYQKALDTDEKYNNNLYEYLAQAYEAKKEYNKAINVYKNMLINIPIEGEKAYSNIGKYYIKLKKLTSAQKYYNKAINLDPLSWYNYYVVGLIEKTNNNDSLAIEYFDKTLTYNPNFEKAYKEIIDIYKSKGDDYHADRYYQKYIKAIAQK